MSLTGGVAGGTTVLMPSAPMGTLRSEEVVPLVVFWDEGELGIRMYGACAGCTHWHDTAAAEDLPDLKVLTPHPILYTSGNKTQRMTLPRSATAHVLFCRAAAMGPSPAGAVWGIAADLSNLVIFQGVEPEGDVADVSSRIEVCEWKDRALGRPVVALERRQPYIPAAQTLKLQRPLHHPGQPIFTIIHGCVRMVVSNP